MGNRIFGPAHAGGIIDGAEVLQNKENLHVTAQLESEAAPFAALARSTLRLCDSTTPTPAVGTRNEVKGVSRNRIFRLPTWSGRILACGRAFQR